MIPGQRCFKLVSSHRQGIHIQMWLVWHTTLSDRDTHIHVCTCIVCDVFHVILCTMLLS